MEIKGDSRVYLVVTTTEYNANSEYSARDCKHNELPELGFDEADMVKVGKLGIGGVVSDFDESGVLVIRVA